ncbi:hypothetical protein AAE478_008473 [Parahypoxylon ruwenzoriense]
MFRRKWAGLPADPDFPIDLKELGYFINEDDEVRSIDNPNYYFKYFLSRNPRWNDRQRYAMNQSLQKVIWERLEGLGLKKELLPLGTADPTKPHVPIFVSGDIAHKSRVVVIFGETVQDLGVLAHRVIGGAGGITKGSMVSIVSELQKQHSSASDFRPPGIILANMGELLWLPECHRTVSNTAFIAAPMKSAVHDGRMLTPKNMVPGNENLKAHVRYIFEEVIEHFVDDHAGLDIIAIGDASDFVEQYLDLPSVWQVWNKRINCLAIVGGVYAVWDLQNEAFGEFLKKKARAYARSTEPAGIVLSGPDGNPKTSTFTQQGCPVFSSGEPYYTECTFIAAAPRILDWLQEVATTPEGEGYVNPEFQILYADPPEPDDGPDWSQCQDKKEGKDENTNFTKEASGTGAEDQKENKKPRLVAVDRDGIQEHGEADAGK